MRRSSCSLFCAALGVGGLALPLRVGGEPVSVTVRISGDRHPLVTVTATSPTSGVERTARATETYSARLDVPVGVWLVGAEAEGFWAESRLATVEPSAGASVELRVWPLGTLAVRMSAATGSQPEQAVARFETTPESGESTTGEADCQQRKNWWLCQLPAGVALDVRFAPRGFVPEYLWGVRVDPSRPLRTQRRLRQGASLTGYAIKGGGSAAGPGCQIELLTLEGEPISGPGGRPAAGFRAITNGRGFFQIAEVPPGDYAVLARAGSWTSRQETVVLMEAAEASLLDDLELAPPASLEVAVLPALDPEAEPWRARLLAGWEGNVSQVGAPAVLHEGRHAWGTLPIGDYTLQILDQHGGIWANRRIELSPESDRVFVQIEQVCVRGQVTLAGEPLEASLTFGGRTGRIRMAPIETDSYGMFYGVLPQGSHANEGWALLVESESPRVNRTVRGVHIPSQHSGEVNVDIDLPDTTLRGLVLHEDGSPVAEPTIITLSSHAEPPFFWGVFGDGDTAHELGPGEFEVRGVAPGSYSVTARSRGRSSSEVPTQIEDSSLQPAHVRLVLGSNRRVTIQVRRADGVPIPGAMIKAGPADRPLMAVPVLRTDSDGNADVDLPSFTTELGLGVGAGGMAYRTMRVPCPREGPVRVALAPLGGTLRVTFDRGRLSAENRRLYSFHEGYFDAVDTLPYFAGGGPTAEGFVIQRLHAGSYTLCTLRPVEIDASLKGSYPNQQCASGILAAGQELALEIEP